MDLFAVHISDGVLAGPWLASGFALAGSMVLAALYRLDPDQIPRIALLGAVFFIASLLHVRVGPTSVHLLLNGLVGVMLGRHAPLAISQGLLLQFLLIGHGGLSTLGVNIGILAVPAVLAGAAFRSLVVRPTALAGATLGVVTVMATVGLNFAVLLFGGVEDWRTLATLVLVSHLPIAAIEGAILAVIVGYLGRIHPEWLVGPQPASEGGNTSSSRTSH